MALSRISSIRKLLPDNILTRNTGLGLNKLLNPLTAFYGGEEILAPLGKGMLRDIGFMDPEGDPEGDFLRDEKRKGAQFSRALTKQRLQKQERINLERLRTQAPDIYASVMAGKNLPQGAVVLGGQQRQDLLQELAGHMGTLGSQDSTPSPF